MPCLASRLALAASWIWIWIWMVGAGGHAATAGKASRSWAGLLPRRTPCRCARDQDPRLRPGYSLTGTRAAMAPPRAKI